MSRRLVRLEEDLGVQLLSRTTRGAELTDAGTAFQDHAAKICAEVALAKETVLPGADLRGRLRVAGPMTFGSTHLAQVFADLAQLQPQLQVTASYTDRMVDIIAEGFDCAIRIGHLQNSNLIARRIGPLHEKLVASPAYRRAHGSPEAPSDIAAHQALMQGTEPWHFMDAEQVITVRPQGRFKSDNAIALISAAVAGLGIAMLPIGLVNPRIAAGDLAEVIPNYPPKSSGIYVVRPPSAFSSRKVRILTDMLMTFFKPELPGSH